MPILNRTFRRGGISQYDLAMHIYIFILVRRCSKQIVLSGIRVFKTLARSLTYADTHHKLYPPLMRGFITYTYRCRCPEQILPLARQIPQQIAEMRDLATLTPTHPHRYPYEIVPAAGNDMATYIPILARWCSH